MVKRGTAKDRLFQREEVVYNLTEDLLVIMETIGVSKKELGRRICESESHVSSLLRGERPLTITKLSDICFELGVELSVNLRVSLSPRQNYEA